MRESTRVLASHFVGSHYCTIVARSGIALSPICDLCNLLDRPVAGMIYMDVCLYHYRGALDHMLRTMFYGKIHRATITQADLNYEGSITIDENLMERAHFYQYERVQIVNVNNGARFETYVIPGERGSGVIGLNGAAARLGAIGDIVIIIGYVLCNEDEARSMHPQIVFVDAKNHPIVPSSLSNQS